MGWQLTEITYNDDIRVKVGMEPPIEVAEVMHSAYHVYTDGSYTGARNTHARSLRPKQRKARGDAEEGFTKEKAGWAAVFYEKGSPPREEECYPLTDGDQNIILRGRVVTGKDLFAIPGSFVGAAKLSNNTVEM